MRTLRGTIVSNCSEPEVETLSCWTIRCGSIRLVEIVSKVAYGG